SIRLETTLARRDRRSSPTSGSQSDPATDEWRLSVSARGKPLVGGFKAIQPYRVILLNDKSDKRRKKIDDVPAPVGVGFRDPLGEGQSGCDCRIDSARRVHQIH